MFVKLLLAVLLPPLGVLLQKGLKGPFWVNLILTILGYVPGVVHAFILIMNEDAHKQTE